MKTLGNLLSTIIVVDIIILFVWTSQIRIPEIFVSQEWNSVVVEKTKSEWAGIHLLYCMRASGEVKQVSVYEITYLKYAVGDTVK